MSREAKLASLHALLLALVCSLPHWVGIWKNRGDYSPFAVSPSVSALTFDEAHAYAPSARRFMSTGKFQAELDNFERRGMSAGIPFIPTAVLGSMGRALGSLERAFIVADCIFPALLFLLFFRITRSTSADPTLSLAVAWSCVVIPFGLLNSLWLGDDALIAPLEITRTPQPEISFLVLMAAAALLGSAITRNANWGWTSAAGLASGAVVYSYYFYAIAWIFALGLLILLGFAWKVRPIWMTGAKTLAIMALLSIPYALETMHGRIEGGQSYLLERMGAHTHRADLLSLIAGILLLAALFLSGRRYLQATGIYFVLTLLVAGSLFGMNVQVLTGYETQPWHFWKRLAVPVCFFLFASAAANLASNSAHLGLARKLARAALFVLVIETAARLIYGATLAAPFQRASDPDHALLSWVRANLPSDQVIGTVNPELILLIPALTTDYTYVPSGLRSLTSTDEITARYSDLACLLGLSPTDVARAASVPNHLHRSTELLQVLGLSYTGDTDILHAFVNGFRDHSCGTPRWRLDYVVVSSTGSSSRAVELHFPQARVIYRNSRYALLQVGKRS